MAIILDGKVARVEIAKRLKEKIVALKSPLQIAIIQVGEKEESSAYIQQKIKFGIEVGISVSHIKFKESANEKEIIEKVELLNEDENVNGIIVQLPIPENLSKQKIIDAIKPSKDVDGLTSFVSKKRTGGDKSAIIPATARGVIELLHFYKVAISGKKVAVLGRSILAGGPIKEVIIFEGGIPTICHSQTPKKEEIKITKRSDIIIVAIGKPKFLTSEFFTADANQVVVDVGINRVTDVGVDKLKEEVPKSKFVGDVDFDNVFPLVGGITPVPGGVGQMTVLALFENLYDCALDQVLKK